METEEELKGLKAYENFGLVLRLYELNDEIREFEREGKYREAARRCLETADCYETLKINFKSMGKEKDFGLDSWISYYEQKYEKLRDKS